MLSTQIKSEHLLRLARFGANIGDAFGCYIFLPPQQTSHFSAHSENDGNKHVVLAGYHSLSNDVIPGCKIEIGHGLIGWVARHRRSIHVSPFERDSRTLGLYHSDQSLKSFIGIPIACPSAECGDLTGVIACDSKKSFAFSKIQGKLLEDLACEISSHLKLSAQINQNSTQKNNWQTFINAAHHLGESLGRDCLEIMRIRQDNYHELEKRFGAGRAFAMVEQVYRLIEQAAPEHFPQIRLPNGDLIIVVDNMMTSLIENKILAFCEHCGINCKVAGKNVRIKVELAIHKEAANARKNKGLTIDEIIQTTSEHLIKGGSVKEEPLVSRKFGLLYEYKRA